MIFKKEFPSKGGLKLPKPHLNPPLHMLSTMKFDVKLGCYIIYFIPNLLLASLFEDRRTVH
jgi:hypothetical protein